MKVRFKEPPSHPPHVFMRTAGYVKYINRQGEESFVRRITGYDFPRFHVYIQNEAQPDMMLSIHIDQKAPTYDGFSAHAGEYDGPVIQQELLRIRDAIEVQLVVLLDKNSKPIQR